MKPNIVFIFSDQQHGRAMGFVDAFFRTPATDRFARESTVFDATFCTTPQCSPSRSTLMTGLYPSKTGMRNNLDAAGARPLSMPTLGAAMQSAGYRTMYYGKWHLGGDPIGTAGWDDRQTFHTDGRYDDPEVTRHATRFLRERGSAGDDQPFLLMLSYNNPHDVYRFRHEHVDNSEQDVPLPESYHRESLANKPEAQLRFMTHDQGTTIHGEPASHWRHYRAVYRDKIAAFDAQVGDVLSALRASGLDENTLVVLNSDHGDMDAHHGLIFKGPFMYEQMVHVPLMIRLPTAMLADGSAPPRQVSSLVSNADLYPTLLDFAGLPEPDCDGQSLKPCLLGEGPAPQREFVVGQYHGKQQWVEPIRMIRTRRHKLNIYATREAELYDLQHDPHELDNLADEPAHASLRDELAGSLRAWMHANGDTFEQLRPLRPGAALAPEG